MTRRPQGGNRTAGSEGPRDGQAFKRRAIKRLGQHFLTPSWAAKVVAAINPQPGDVFLEIGPGTGALTLPLAATGAPVLAVEIDRVLAADLARRAPSNVTLLAGDILETDVTPFLTGLEPQRAHGSAASSLGPTRRYRIVGNLPYYIASPILFRMLDLHHRHNLFTDAVVMLQREVGDRLLAKPKTKAYGVLTIMLSLHARITRRLDLPPTAFKPPPKVRSTLVGLTFGPPAVRVVDQALFDRVVKTMFNQRRKTLANALKPVGPTAVAALALADIDGRRRPETLQLSEIARLVEVIASSARTPVL